MALALVNDLFLAPNLHTILSRKVAAVHQRVRAFAIAILRGESADPLQSANLLREITALHPDISALVIESSAGWARGAAGRTAAAALVAEASAAGALTSLPAGTLPSLRGALAKALADMNEEQSRALRLQMQQRMRRLGTPTRATRFSPVMPSTSLRKTSGHKKPSKTWRRSTPSVSCQNTHLPLAPAAARNSLRAFLTVAISAILLSLGGWPFAVQAVALVGVTMALSATQPSPRAFAGAAVIAMPIAALLAGVTEFLILELDTTSFLFCAIRMRHVLSPPPWRFQRPPAETGLDRVLLPFSSPCSFRRRTRRTTTPKPICTLA